MAKQDQRYAAFLQAELECELEKPLDEQDAAKIDQYTLLLARLEGGANLPSRTRRRRDLRTIRAGMRMITSPRHVLRERRAGLLLCAILCITLAGAVTVSAMADLTGLSWINMPPTITVGDKTFSISPGVHRDYASLDALQADFPIDFCYPAAERFPLHFIFTITRKNTASWFFKFRPGILCVVNPTSMAADAPTQFAEVEITRETVQGKPTARFAWAGCSYTVSAPDEGTLEAFLAELTVYPALP